MAYKFTVILVRPDYMAGNYGTDIFITHVETEDNDAAHAASVGKCEGWNIDNSGPDGLQEDPIGGPEDYFCVAVYEGHLDCVYGD